MEPSSERAAPLTQPLFCWGRRSPCSHTGQGLGGGQCPSGTHPHSPPLAGTHSTGIAGSCAYCKDVARLGFSPAASQLGTLDRSLGHRACASPRGPEQPPSQSGFDFLGRTFCSDVKQ